MCYIRMHYTCGVWTVNAIQMGMVVGCAFAYWCFIDNSKFVYRMDVSDNSIFNISHKLIYTLIGCDSKEAENSLKMELFVPLTTIDIGHSSGICSYYYIIQNCQI